MLPDERMVDAAWAALPGDDVDRSRGILMAAFATLDREALIAEGMAALRSTGIDLALRERSEAVLRAVGLIA